jgi:AraC family transcriptional regulator
MTYPTGVQRLERRNGKSAAIGTARSGVVTIIPAGSSARWDISGPVNVVQLYLPHRTLERVAGEAETSAPCELLERTGHPDPIISRLLISASDAIGGSAALDALFRHQLNDLLATRLLAAHAGAPAVFQPAVGGLAPMALRRAIERFALGRRYGRIPCRAGFGCRPVALLHFCRAFKERRARRTPGCASTGLEQAMKMLRDTDDPGRSIAARAWLLLANGLAAGIQESRPAKPRAIGGGVLAVIALQRRQSSGQAPDQLDHHHVKTRTRQMMIGRTSSADWQSRQNEGASRPPSCTDFRWLSASLQRQGRRWKSRRNPRNARTC